MAGRRVPSGALVVAVAVLVSGCLAACSGGGSEVGAVTGSPSATPSLTPSPTPVPTTTPPSLSPFTGKPVEAGKPVLAVKIDNVAAARPQTGLTSADVVYVEPVEGGLSRILAIYSSKIPAKIGPVRSARESDLELLAEYGKVGLAFSGANKGVLAAVSKAPVVDLSQDRVPSDYHRSSSRAAPHNLYIDPKALIHGRTLANAHDIGFTFGPLPAGGTKTSKQKISYQAASTSFTWSAKRNGWNVSLDGRSATSTDGGQVTAATVVIQYTKITQSGYHDVLGNPTPYTHTVGSGDALILRNGVKIKAHWSRSAKDKPTTFTTKAGAPVPFATGQVWVVYAPKK
jgi:hypothetical protein